MTLPAPAVAPPGLVAAVRGATKRYPGVLALDNVDFSIAPGEIRALLGKNGAGKSTLIRLLTGATEPDGGEVLLGGRPLTGTGTQRTVEAGRLGVRAVYQELSLIPSMSIAENLFLGHWPSRGGVLAHGTMDRLSRATLGGLGLDLDPSRKVETLSPAERQLVEIARVLVGEPQLVILDEPTSSLAAAEVDLLFRAVRKLAASGIAVIYVSHRMAEIRQIAASATVMRDGRIAGTVDVAGAATGEIVRMMLGHDAQEEHLVEASSRGEVVLQVSGLVSRPKIAGVAFDLRRGEVLGLAGLLGVGRTELLRAIAGLAPIQAGTVTMDGRDVTAEPYARRVRGGLGFTPESRKEDGILPLLGVDENIVAADWSMVTEFGVISASRMTAAARTIIERIAIKAARPGTPVGTLSGGNQQKAVIGRWIYADARILLLDEPTRGVDVEAKLQIYGIIRQLAAAGRSVIFVSSEVEELPKTLAGLLAGSLLGSAWAAETKIGFVVKQPEEPWFQDEWKFADQAGKEKGFTVVKIGAEDGEKALAAIDNLGASELFRLVYGADARHGGRVTLAGTPYVATPKGSIGVGLVMCPEDRKADGIVQGRSVEENIVISARRHFSPFGLIDRAREAEVADGFIEKLRVRTPHRRQDIVNLSGGNQQKTILARWLAEPAVKVMLVDEPTRGIDVGAKAEIYAILYDLAEKGLAVGLVSSDLPEVMGVCDRVLVMRTGRIVAEFRREAFDDHAILAAALPADPGDHGP